MTTTVAIPVIWYAFRSLVCALFLYPHLTSSGPFTLLCSSFLSVKPSFHLCRKLYDPSESSVGIPQFHAPTSAVSGSVHVFQDPSPLNVPRRIETLLTSPPTDLWPPRKPHRTRSSVLSLAPSFRRYTLSAFSLCKRNVVYYTSHMLINILQSLAAF